MSAAVTTSEVIAHLEPVQRMSRDIRKSAATLGRSGARYLVDTYYAIQRQRIALADQHRQAVAVGEPAEIIAWLTEQMRVLEAQAQGALGTWSKGPPLGQWALAQKGIGPVLCAGLLAHIDLEKVQTYGQVWSFAGLNPSVTWEKGQKRPWNADLKRLCWLIGESFVKVSGRDGATYGKLWRDRKERENARNAAGDFADEARRRAEELRKKRGEASLIELLETGKLPDKATHERSKRWTVKLFLSHYTYVGFLLAGRMPPITYSVAHQGHAHYIAPIVSRAIAEQMPAEVREEAIEKEVIAVE